MGLDMYLEKIKKVDGMTFDELMEANNNLDELMKTGEEPYPKIKDDIFEAGEYCKWKSISHKIGYWRKANMVHAWFVREIQGGVDECQETEVPREKLEELLAICKKIKKPSDGRKFLPTQGGFFFGGLEYDDYYMGDIKSTIEQLEKVLAETDFDAYHVFYCSSW